MKLILPIAAALLIATTAFADEASRDKDHKVQDGTYVSKNNDSR